MIVPETMLTEVTKYFELQCQIRPRPNKSGNRKGFTIIQRRKLTRPQLIRELEVVISILKSTCIIDELDNVLTKKIRVNEVNDAEEERLENEG